MILLFLLLQVGPPHYPTDPWFKDVIKNPEFRKKTQYIRDNWPKISEEQIKSAKEEYKKTGRLPDPEQCNKLNPNADLCQRDQRILRYKVKPSIYVSRVIN